MHILHILAAVKEYITLENFPYEGLRNEKIPWLTIKRI